MKAFAALLVLFTTSLAQAEMWHGHNYVCEDAGKYVFQMACNQNTLLLFEGNTALVFEKTGNPLKKFEIIGTALTSRPEETNGNCHFESSTLKMDLDFAKETATAQIAGELFPLTLPCHVDIGGH